LVFLAKVLGSMVSTQKDKNLVGLKMLVVQPVNVETLQPEGKPLIAVDSVGAGEGSVVMVVTGSSARNTTLTRSAPTDATIVAIVDNVEVAGRMVYKGNAGL